MISRKFNEDEIQEFMRFAKNSNEELLVQGKTSVECDNDGEECEIVRCPGCDAEFEHCIQWECDNDGMVNFEEEVNVDFVNMVISAWEEYKRK